MRMLRVLIKDARDFPATMALAVLWVVVFVAMVVCRLQTPPTPSAGEILHGNIGVVVTHRFGDMTLDALRQGQVWRAVTSTFVHYNVLHLAMNLYGFYVLGSILESWYGPGQLALVYVLTGGCGNLLAALARHALGHDPRMHSGGGSTVVLGLVGLCAVVGWRSKSRRGDYLRRQMVGALLFTAFLGQVVTVIDNWGHAGGALAGALIGFAHRPMVRIGERRASRWVGVVATLLLAACGAAQLRENRLNDSFTRLRVAQRVEMHLPIVENFYQQALQRSAFEHATLVPRNLYNPGRTWPRIPNVPPPLTVIDSDDAQWRVGRERCFELLNSIEAQLRSARDAAEIRRVRRLLQTVFERPPKEATLREFRAHVASLLQSARQQRTAAQARYAALSRRLW